MESETIIKNDNAKTMYVSNSRTYGIFCWNTQGDLFLNSDWGFYGFAWRSYGKDFTSFLKQCNADYIAGKLGYNWNQFAAKAASFNGKREQVVTSLIESFLIELNKQA